MEELAQDKRKGGPQLSLRKEKAIKSILKILADEKVPIGDIDLLLDTVKERVQTMPLMVSSRRGARKRTVRRSRAAKAS